MPLWRPASSLRLERSAMSRGSAAAPWEPTEPIPVSDMDANIRRHRPHNRTSLLRKSPCGLRQANHSADNMARIPTDYLAGVGSTQPLIESAIEVLRAHLPSDWSVDAATDAVPIDTEPFADAVRELKGPGRRTCWHRWPHRRWQWCTPRSLHRLPAHSTCSRPTPERTSFSRCRTTQPPSHEPDPRAARRLSPSDSLRPTA